MNRVGVALRSLGVLGLVTASACFRDEGAGVSADGDGTDESGEDESESAESGETGDDSCGDGRVDAGEECDLAAQNSDNGMCTTACKEAACGDGLVHLGVEACDDGNAVDDDECTSVCAHPTCGDGFMQAGEECDDGEDNGPGKACNLDCTADVCGNSNVGPDEECDNGPNNGPGQVCKADCTANVCGDSDVGPSEGCDDGNMMDGDGCSSTCIGENCGDGKLDGGEECDDGNMDNTDECTQLCKTPVCGDGYPQGGEECDGGGNNGDTKACTSGCKMAACGDGLVWMGQEACDDGNMINTDGCAQCKLPKCGDGFVQQGNNEQCDDGNGQNGDGCSASCKFEGCGNNVVDPGEECDDGANGNQDDGCTDACKAPKCGDGITQANIGEQCDDANMNNFDACPNDCKNAVCGDAVLEGLEQCDSDKLGGKTCVALDFDGGMLACNGMCTFDTAMCHKCGDGQKSGPEECDDGNLMGGDGCSPACTIEQDANYVFITESTWTANLGGLVGADQKCQAAADAANLPGTYVALLSTGAVDAPERIKSAAGWVGTNGRPFANTHTDLFTAHELFYPIDTDENGKPVTGVVWTGTGSDGTVANACSDWTSAVGIATGGEIDSAWPAWTSYYTLGCNDAGHLYCFGTDKVTDVTPEPPKDVRLAFLTRSLHLPAGSLAKMDDLCQTEAEDAGIDGGGARTFLALLGVDDASPISRFDLQGDNWYRLDGVALAATPDDVAAAKRLAPLTLGPDGIYYSGRPWTGASGIGQQVPGETCKDWTSVSNGNVGRKGWAEHTNSQFGWPAGGCGGTQRFYCLEK